MTETLASSLAEYLDPAVKITYEDGIAVAPVVRHTPGMEANSHYFSHPKWVENWFQACHRYPEFRERWRAATGPWDGKVVVDVGCGPGNAFATVGGSPRVLIGVDIARGSLQAAKEIGYTPLLADAQDLPLKSGFADVVAMCAAIHHCDDMARALAEGARLVAPGGVLVTDHDPAKSSFDLRGAGMFVWKAREPLYRLIGRGGHGAEDDEQTWAIATELHHKPGDGVTRELFMDTLVPLGFDVKLIQHNNTVGAAALEGETGRAPMKMRVAQRLSGIRPDDAESAMTMMCVARRKNDA